jgi:hypothetical protein
LNVAVRLHATLRAVPLPDHLSRRSDDFAIADRMAWAELPLPTEGRLADHLQQLARHRAPVAAEPQVVHGDLAGNLLWEKHLPPAVIDMSPYWRPGGLGPAQLVTDATLWYGADLSLAEALLDFEPDQGRQLVLRALIFRLAVDAQLDRNRHRGIRWDRNQVHWDLKHAGPLAAWATGSVLW